MLLLLYAATIINGQPLKTYTVQSPDKTIEVVVTVTDAITYMVTVDGKLVVAPSPISMTVGNNQVLGQKPVVSNVRRRTIGQQLTPVVPVKSAVIEDHGNELTLVFKGNYAVIFRAYDNGVAYRFQSNLSGDLKVVSEQATFNFADTNYVYFPEEDRFFSHNERTYRHWRLDTLAAGRLASLPVLVATPGPKILIAESALRDYPGLWVKTGGGNTLNGIFPPYPLECRPKANSDRDVPVTKCADYIALTKGNRSYPWRILAIAKKDGDLITNQLVYQLAEELQIADPSWIKPGKVAWDWWNANNIYGVDFKSGVNTATYKYYIDFASKYGIEYIILDEGWYKLGNLLEVVPEMNVEALIAYGQQKNVGIILWVIWKTLEDQLVPALDQFEKWGVAGIKVDFMQRDDQEMVNFYWKIAAEAAKRKLLVDFHGAYKPCGLRRAYPNVITREGVKGLEHNKWSQDITPTHNLTLPFIRMVPGPMDYTPGAMLNAQLDDFRIVFTRPMSMGTRMHQIAMYIIFESPLQMMADSPSNYLQTSECAAFIASIPTTWEATRVFEARVGEYLVLARKKAGNWYLGAMTNEHPREFKIDLAFLDDRAYSATIMEDGINAERYGSDYRKITRTISKSDALTIKLAPGGGWAAILMPGAR
ncbi:glycoside hydrolase family 97 protein [candidate division KSB1 bacterium]|nr:glycoside hydrolase family 97 protein [candidate division KSB1 bacterium]